MMQRWDARVFNRRKRVGIIIVEQLLKCLYKPARTLIACTAGVGTNVPTTDIRNILFVRLDGIGDMLLSTPALRALRNSFPQAKITILCNPASRGILEGNPDVDDIIIYDAPWLNHTKKINPFSVIFREEYLKLIRRLREAKFDIAIELRGDLRDILLVAVASGAKWRVGCGYRGGTYLLDCDTEYNPKLHRVEHNLKIIETLLSFSADSKLLESKLRHCNRFPSEAEGMNGNKLGIYPSVEDRKFAMELWQAVGIMTSPPTRGGHYLIAFHLGSKPLFVQKYWPIVNFAAVGDALMKQYGAKIVVVGAEHERRLAGKLTQKMEEKPIDLTGKTSLLQLAALLERCHLFIGNDSAPMHIAAAVGTPVIGLFGSSEPQWYAPYGDNCVVLYKDLPCSPCAHIHCIYDENICMKKILPEEVIATANRLLEDETRNRS